MTAIEWAQEQIEIILYYIDFEDADRIKEIFDEAREYEKSQTIKAYHTGILEGYEDAVEIINLN